MDCFYYSLTCFYMNVDKWTQCGQFLLINGPSAVIVLYWTPDGSYGCVIVQVGFWIELLVQRRLCLIFVKLWIPINGTQRCSIELYDIHRLSVG